MVEQPALSLQATAVARESSIGADDPMTRDDDGNRVGAVGQPHRTSAVPETQPACNRAVRRRLAGRDFEETCPYTTFELRPMHGERQCRRVGASTGEVVVEPGACAIEDGVWRVVDPVRREPPQKARVEPALAMGMRKLERGERAIRRQRDHRSDRRLEYASTEDVHVNRVPRVAATAWEGLLCAVSRSTIYRAVTILLADELVES